MSTIVKTEAVVLKAMKYRETSKIATFYTRQFGKVAGIIKGARRAKSMFGSSLEPMSYVSVVFYKKEGREIQTVSHCDLMKPFHYLYQDLDKMAIGMALIELVNNVAHEQEQNIPMFKLLVNSLNALNSATKNYQNLLYYFELHLAKVLGFEPSFNRCVSCKKMIISDTAEDRKYRFHIDKGGLLCDRCKILPGNLNMIQTDVLKILRQMFESNSMESVFEKEMNIKTKSTLENFLWTYLQYHVTGLRSLKSQKVFSKIMDIA